jgi:hypothetical protein
MTAMTTVPTNQSEDFRRRLTAVEGRLEALSVCRLEGRTEADSHGERWDAPALWAHLAEVIPYWIAQAERVLAARTFEPVPFGRTPGSPERFEAIERHRHRGQLALWHDVREDLCDLRAFLDEIPASGWQLRGLHPALGPMTVTEIVEECLVSHLEEHAGQLESLRV